MFLLYEYDSGIDGWDARSTPVAIFSTITLAEQKLKEAGYTVVEQNNHYYPADNAKRYTMGAIHYFIKGDLPLDDYNFK